MLHSYVLFGRHNAVRATLTKKKAKSQGIKKRNGQHFCGFQISILEWGEHRLCKWPLLSANKTNTPITWLTNSPIVTPAATDIILSANEKPLEYCSAELWYVWVRPPPWAIPDLKREWQVVCKKDKGAHRHKKQDTSNHWGKRGSSDHTRVDIS